jgi:hypothetical protein
MVNFVLVHCAARGALFSESGRSVAEYYDLGRSPMTNLEGHP